jgi:hypothetical protein
MEINAMPTDEEHPDPERIPSADESDLPVLEADQTIPPRPEEEIADALRAKPDVADHSRDLQ